MVLGHEDDWCLKNACPCCMYLLQGEPDFHYSILSTMDSNDSLKQVEQAWQTHDNEGKIIAFENIECTRLHYLNSYYLSPQEVSWYKDKVKEHCEVLQSRPNSGLYLGIPLRSSDLNHQPQSAIH
jgi:hypothetical protein